ncbi:hypothetical protein A2U01_0082359, partial [Trifolium medium]|nr:hypothetical protein [Trifolium medium]
STLSSGSSSKAVSGASFVGLLPASLALAFSIISTFLLRSSIALLCSSLILEISLAKC